MEKHRKVWKSIEKHGKASKSMEKYGKAWKSIEKYGKVWKSIEKHIYYYLVLYICNAFLRRWSYEPDTKVIRSVAEEIYR